MSDDVGHGEYVIHPTPRQPNGAGPWLAELQVARAADSGTRVQLFNTLGAFATRAHAVARCVEHGCDLIEGRVLDRAMLF